MSQARRARTVETTIQQPIVVCDACRCEGDFIVTPPGGWLRVSVAEDKDSRDWPHERDSFDFCGYACLSIFAAARDEARKVGAA